MQVLSHQCDMIWGSISSKFHYSISFLFVIVFRALLFLQKRDFAIFKLLALHVIKLLFKIYASDRKHECFVDVCDVFGTELSYLIFRKIMFSYFSIITQTNHFNNVITYILIFLVKNKINTSKISNFKVLNGLFYLVV